MTKEDAEEEEEGTMGEGVSKVKYLDHDFNQLKASL